MRWAAKDPIFFRGGQANLFVYVRNDPIRYKDPAGLGPSSVDIPPELKDEAAVCALALPVAAAGIVAWPSIIEAGGELIEVGNELFLDAAGQYAPQITTIVSNYLISNYVATPGRGEGARGEAKSGLNSLTNFYGKLGEGPTQGP